MTDPMTPAEVARLKARAEACPQVSWRYEAAGNGCSCSVETDGDIVCEPDPNHPIGDYLDTVNFAHIAGMDPTTTVRFAASHESLRAALERAERELQGCQRGYDTQKGLADAYLSAAQGLKVDLAAACAENEKLRGALEQIGRAMNDIGPYSDVITAAEFVQRVTRAALAGTDAAAPQDAWRPIATAPKDGTTVLLYHRVDPWDVYGYGHWEDVRGISGWLAYGLHDPPGNLGLGAPTHWQPLPPAPQEPSNG